MAAAAGFPTKPHSAFPEQPSNFRQITSKSHSNALCKTLIILVLLLVIPLFPSQPPDFITDTVLTEFWEIIHLLFIGIAVSYGLFGRRTDKIVDSRNDDYLSGISHINSIFDNGYENICAPDEQMMQSYANCECVQRSGNRILVKDRCVVDSAKKTRSFVSNDEIEIDSEENGKNLKQIWCSQFVKGESLVVVSNGKYFVGESSDYKPLNLPVRSLKSRAVDGDELVSTNVNDSSLDIEAKGKGYDDGDVKVVKIRGVVPLNLEKKFAEVSGRSPIPWRSRSGRMEYGDERRDTKAPAHCRPHSVGEFEFEQHFNSRSIRGAKFSASPELGSSKMESGKRKRAFKVPKIAPVDTEVLPFGFVKTRPLSDGASVDAIKLADLENSKEKLIDDHSEKEELGKGKQVVAQSTEIAKSLTRAKSVRTIKPNRYVSEADSSVRNGRAKEPENCQNQELGRVSTKQKPKPTLPRFLEEEKQDIDDRNATEPQEDKEGANDGSSDEGDARTNIENDPELYGSEVDRKADEFIAKFREQIRRQKTSSIGGC